MIKCTISKYSIYDARFEILEMYSLSIIEIVKIKTLLFLKIIYFTLEAMIEPGLKQTFYWPIADKKNNNMYLIVLYRVVKSTNLPKFWIV